MWLAVLLAFLVPCADGLMIIAPHAEVLLAKPSNGSATQDLQNVFCWMIAGSFDATLHLAIEQLSYCGGHAIFSNYSDASTNTIQLFSGSMTVEKTKGGWAALSPMVLSAWTYISNSTLPEKFDWFIKLEPDTYFRPYLLPAILSKYDSGTPVGLGPGGRFRGSFEVVSRAVFRHVKTPILLAPSQPGADDVWLTGGFKAAGFEIAADTTIDNCEALCASYFDVAHKYLDSARRNVFPSMLLADVETTRSGGCLHKDIVSIHPVKDVAVFQEFRRLDAEKRGASANTKSFWERVLSWFHWS